MTEFYIKDGSLCAKNAKPYYEFDFIQGKISHIAFKNNTFGDDQYYIYLELQDGGKCAIVGNKNTSAIRSIINSLASVTKFKDTITFKTVLREGCNKDGIDFQYTSVRTYHGLEYLKWKVDSKDLPSGKVALINFYDELVNEINKKINN